MNADVDAHGHVQASKASLTSPQILVQGGNKARGNDGPAKNASHPALPRFESMHHILREVFLPVQYPLSVSPDYTRYQVFNALQAFCSSLAGLIAARAVLEGFGIGDASASATNAVSLSIIQDACAIFAGYVLGTSLSPEAKTYRLLADVFNDCALVLDTFSPFFNTLDAYGFPKGSGTAIRAVALCISASLRALCGLAAQSKAQLTLHFANGGVVPGDIGDLNAKDGSKETVLALFGSLAGWMFIPLLTTPLATYTALAVLVLCHLGANYTAVRGVAFRSLNRQRMSILWQLFNTAPSGRLHPDTCGEYEAILRRPDIVHDIKTGRSLGRCFFVSSQAKLQQLSGGNGQKLDSACTSLLDPLSGENFNVWISNPFGAADTFDGRVYLTLEPGYKSSDLLKAWLVGTQFLCLIGDSGRAGQQLRELVIASCTTVNSQFVPFMDELRTFGWQVDDGLIVSGVPVAVDVQDLTTSLDKKQA